MTTLTTPLVGMHFNPPAKQVLAILPVGTLFLLEVEPDNPYDPEAIMVLLDLGPVCEALAKLPEVEEAFVASLAGTGFEYEEIQNHGGPLKIGHVGASGRGPCQKLGLPGTTEVHAVAAALPYGVESLAAELGFNPDGAPTLKITPKGGEA